MKSEFRPATATIYITESSFDPFIISCYPEYQHDVDDNELYRLPYAIKKLLYERYGYGVHVVACIISNLNGVMKQIDGLPLKGVL
jgi:hypothetical protein